MSKFYRKSQNQGLPAGCVFLGFKTVPPVSEWKTVAAVAPVAAPAQPKVSGPVLTLKQLARKAEQEREGEIRRLKMEKKAAKEAAKAAKEAAAAAAKAAKPVRLRKDGKPWGSPKD